MSFLKVNAVTAKNFYECGKLILIFVVVSLSVYLDECAKDIENGRKNERRANDSDSGDNKTQKLQHEM